VTKLDVHIEESGTVEVPFVAPSSVRLMTPRVVRSRSRQRSRSLALRAITPVVLEALWWLLARQKASGLFANGTQMAEQNSEKFLDVGLWDELSNDVREVFARYMEVHAASVESVDENLGRLLDVVARVSVTALEDGAFEWTNGTARVRAPRDGPEAVRAMDLPLASLGMCVAGTIRAFARSHGIEGLESVNADVLGEEVGPSSRLWAAGIAISLGGRVSDEDAIRLRRSSAHCKIHTTLATGVDLRIL
jgi:uncharacterized OsmC-like protein